MRDECELADLMTRALDGDERAYRAFLERVAGHVRALARWKLRLADPSDLEDIVQETILAIHAKRHTWRRDRPIGPWIGAIARHKMVDQMRRRGSRGTVDIDDVVDVLAAPSDDETCPRDLIDAALVSLPRGQRLVVSALTIEGRSIRETASRLGTTEVAVRVAFHRALARIRALVGGAS
ncbi:sigma-70 family RNA polymerase sigma factor [Chthonobacter rhizosphaerae]|uniref:sigma-70 family RNA polymerase sigma factor n=1 Tax=Chthonobacter rhizosphaerae TaxID=2735553 RepID=UPI0031B6304D